MFTLLGLIVGVGAAGASYAMAKKKKVGTGGSAAVGAAVGVAAGWFAATMWPVVLAGGVVYYVIDRNKKQKALKAAE